MTQTASPATSAYARARDKSRPFPLRIGAPEVVFVALLLLGAGIVLSETRGMNFFYDDWEFILHRRGLSADVLLRPHAQHLSLIPILVYKLLLAVFGASSYLPFRFLSALALGLMALGLALVT